MGPENLVSVMVSVIPSLPMTAYGTVERHCMMHPSAPLMLRGNTYFCMACVPPTCPECDTELLTWSDIHKRRSETGILALLGALNDNMYCLSDPENHPFYCYQHRLIHPEKCQHEVSGTFFEEACRKCGDIVIDVSHLRE